MGTIRVLQGVVITHFPLQWTTTVQVNPALGLSGSVWQLAGTLYNRLCMGRHSFFAGYYLPCATLAIALAILLFSACRQDEGTGDATASTAAIMPQETASPEATATPRPTPSPSPSRTPRQASVSAIEQSVGDDGNVVISNVFALEPGWLVVYADDGGEPGAVLGHVAVDEGEQDDVVVTVNPYDVTPALHAILHDDRGELGTFEFPGPDEPLQQGAEPVGATFQVDLRATIPGIEVSDQPVEENGQVVVESVSSPTAGWLVIRADDGEESGAILGQTPVAQGQNENVVVSFDWRSATRQLHAELYRDGGRSGRFEPPEPDTPVLVDDEPIRATFTVTLPPDVFVLDQPTVTGEIVVERAVINAPGWISVFSNFEGFTDRLLGFAPLQPGTNERVTVPIEGRITDSLHILLHEDTGVSGEFEYPAGDPPLRDEGGRPILFTFQTDAGNYVITRDQAPGKDGSVEVPLVVIDLEAWVAIWSDDEGLPGELLGQTLLPAGIHRDVSVALESDHTGETLHVVLHQDLPPAGEFEPPPGPDAILQREGEPIDAPFNLLASP